VRALPPLPPSLPYHHPESLISVVLFLYSFVCVCVYWPLLTTHVHLFFVASMCRLRDKEDMCSASGPWGRGRGFHLSLSEIKQVKRQEEMLRHARLLDCRFRRSWRCFVQSQGKRGGVYVPFSATRVSTTRVGVKSKK